MEEFLSGAGLVTAAYLSVDLSFVAGASALVDYGWFSPGFVKRFLPVIGPATFNYSQSLGNSKADTYAPNTK